MNDTMFNISLNESQSDCIEDIIRYLKDFNSEPSYTVPYSVDGFAGTGKTTIISYLTKVIKEDRNLKYQYKDIAFLTFTGKASSVLKSKLDDYNVINTDLDFVGTIHSFLYIPILEYDQDTGTKKIVGWRKRDVYGECDLIIIDESSMVDMSLLSDLMDCAVPIVMFGDSFQLPPVSTSKENNKSNKYLYNPDFKLTEIHRQALDNPIIYLSKFVRENFFIPNGIFSKSVFKLNWNNQNTKDMFYNIDFSNFDNINEISVLSGYNNTRISINKLIRKKIGFPKHLPICTGEKIICLNNDRVISNGQLGIVLLQKYQPMFDLWKLDVRFDNDLIHQVYCHEKFFNNSKKYNVFDEMKILKNQYPKLKNNINCFTYGYCLTVHKAQGSEFDKVVLFEERLPNMSDYEYARWLYTGITRSKEKLFVINR